MERHPSRLFEVLHETGALSRVIPEMELLYEEPDHAREAMRLLDLAAVEERKLEVRVAVLARACDPFAIESLAERLKVPSACRDLALLAARHTNLIVDAQELDAAELLELFDSTDAWRRPDRFADLVDAALVAEENADAVRARLQAALRAAAAVNAGDLARQAKTPAEIRSLIDGARLAAIRQAIKQT
jgi:tRNA nucleotidyltransferase (CCA-adding enzyme)